MMGHYTIPAWVDFRTDLSYLAITLNNARDALVLAFTLTENEK